MLPSNWGPGLILAATICAVGCRRAGVSGAPTACPNPFSLASEQIAPRIPTVSRPVQGKATIVGAIVDSTSGRAVIAGVVRLTGIDDAAGELTFANTDSAGGFAAVGVRPGRYRRMLGAANYRLLRDTIVVAEGVDTMLVALQRGLPICRVELTKEQK